MTALGIQPLRYDGEDPQDQAQRDARPQRDGPERLRESGSTRERGRLGARRHVLPRLLGVDFFGWGLAGVFKATGSYHVSTARPPPQPDALAGFSSPPAEGGWAREGERGAPGSPAPGSPG